MNTWKALSVVSLALVWPGVALAQDSVTVAPTHYKVVFENPSVRVLRIDYAPGTKSAMHQHPDSIVIPLTPSKVRFATPDGKSTDSELASESATYMPAGAHSPSNVGAGRVDALLVEFKSAAPGKAALPTARPGMMSKALAEGPRAIAYRSTADLPGASRFETRLRSGRHRTGIRADVAGDRRQAGEDDLDARRGGFRRTRRSARSKKCQRQAGGFHHRRDQVADTFFRMEPA